MTTSAAQSFPTTSTQPVVYKKGARVIDYIMRRSAGAKLTEDQAMALWDECAKLLKSDRLGRTVREALESETGNLDTLPRGDVVDAIARILTGERWPLNGASREESKKFLQALVTEMKARGYQACD